MVAFSIYLSKICSFLSTCVSFPIVGPELPLLYKLQGTIETKSGGTPSQTSTGRKKSILDIKFYFTIYNKLEAILNSKNLTIP